MSDYLQSLMQHHKELVGKPVKGSLSVLFSTHAPRSLEDQLKLQADFSSAIGLGQTVKIVNLSPLHIELSVSPKGLNSPHKAESLEDCANASMFDLLAKNHQISAIDFRDEDYDGGVDYANVEPA